MSKKYVLGADIGGSHIACAAARIENAELVESSYTAEKINSKADTSNEILDGWAMAIKKAAEKVGVNEVEGVGFAIPGPFDYQNGIGLYTGSNDKFTALYQVNIRKEMSARTGIPESRIFFSNDAACFGIGEHWSGAGKDFQTMIGITLGTGFGAVFIKNGNYVVEGKGVPKGGELWDYPYKGTIAEDFVSTRWFVKRFEELGGGRVSGVLEIAQEFEKNSIAQQVFNEFAHNLVDILEPSIREFEASGIVMGGNIAKASDFFLVKAKELLDAKGLKVAITTSTLFDYAAILGAAKLVLDNEQ